VKLTVCDRCGDDHHHRAGFANYQLMTSSPVWQPIDREFDLCQSCASILSNWLREMREAKFAKEMK